jgi:CHAT domain-containing protein
VTRCSAGIAARGEADESFGENGAVLVEYFGLGDRPIVFVLRADAEHADAFELEVSLAELAAFVRKQVVDAVRPLSDAAAWRELAARLLEPVLGSAAVGEPLWFVAHDSLHLLPLHAAPIWTASPAVSDGGEEVVLDRHPVCYSPSATVMQFCQRKRRATRRSALVVGDPTGDLPYAALEAEAVADAFGVEPVVGPAATRERVVGALVDGGADVLHFACHGFFDDDRAMQSGVVLADGNLTAQDLLGLTIEPSLVTVSACRSGMQERRPGDELLGLTRALLYAGAPSIVVSLWPIDDLSTQLVMEAFYASVRSDPRTRLVDALRNAQLHVRDLTAQAVVDRCESTLADLTAADPRRAQLLAARAKTEAAALDYASAAASFADASAAADGSPDADRFARSAALVAFKARARSAPADYARRPFADPYYWAPFLLFGDWR